MCSLGQWRTTVSSRVYSRAERRFPRLIQCAGHPRNVLCTTPRTLGGNTVNNTYVCNTVFRTRRRPERLISRTTQFYIFFLCTPGITAKIGFRDITLRKLYPLGARNKDIEFSLTNGNLKLPRANVYRPKICPGRNIFA